MGKHVSICHACQQLSAANRDAGDGFHPVDTLLRQIESNRPNLESLPTLREIEDICRFSLRFPSGAIADCVSAYSIHTRRSLAVSTPEATLSIENAFAYDGLSLHVERKQGATAAQEQRRFPPRSQFADEMDAFADAIRRDRTPLTPGEEGLQDLRLMAAIYRAAGSGRAVSLPAVAGKDVTRGTSFG